MPQSLALGYGIVSQKSTGLKKFILALNCDD